MSTFLAVGGQQNSSWTCWSLTSRIASHWYGKAWEDIHRTLTNVVQPGRMFSLSQDSLYDTDFSLPPRFGDYTLKYSSTSDTLLGRHVREAHSTTHCIQYILICTELTWVKLEVFCRTMYKIILNCLHFPYSLESSNLGVCLSSPNGFILQTN